MMTYILVTIVMLAQTNIGDHGEKKKGLQQEQTQIEPEYVSLTCIEYVLDRSGQRKPGTFSMKFDYISGKLGEKRLRISQVDPKGQEEVIKEIREDGKRRYELIRNKSGKITDINIQRQQSLGHVYSENVFAYLGLAAPDGKQLSEVLKQDDAIINRRNDQGDGDIEVTFNNKGHQVICVVNENQGNYAKKVSIITGSDKYVYEATKFQRIGNIEVPTKGTYTEYGSNGENRRGFEIENYSINNVKETSIFNISEIDKRIPRFDETKQNKIASLRNLGINSEQALNLRVHPESIEVSNDNQNIMFKSLIAVICAIIVILGLFFLRKFFGKKRVG